MASQHPFPSGDSPGGGWEVKTLQTEYRIPILKGLWFSGAGWDPGWDGCTDACQSGLTWGSRVEGAGVASASTQGVLWGRWVKEGARLSRAWLPSSPEPLFSAFWDLRGARRGGQGDPQSHSRREALRREKWFWYRGQALRCLGRSCPGQLSTPHSFKLRDRHGARRGWCRGD